MKILSVLVAICPFFFSQAQELSSKTKRGVVDNLIELIEENYVLRDSVDLLVSGLKKLPRSDEFKVANDPGAFAQLLTAELREISGDAHFAVMNNPSLATQLQNLGAENQSGGPNVRRRVGSIGIDGEDVKKNYFLRKLENLDGNVGYMSLERVPSLEEAQATVDAAFAFLSNSDAFILDLRGNPGGIGGFIPYFMSYFFEEKKIELYRRELTALDSVSYLYTYKDLPGKRLTDIPIFILIDQYTGSAATNLSYTMQAFDKATLVGERTGMGYRGAHSAGGFPLSSGFVGLVPIGRVVNARTGTNWRDSGVIPSVEVSSKTAFATAYKLALETLLAANPTEEVKEALKMLEESEKPSTAAEDSALAIFQGTYEGNRKIWMEDGELKYSREGRGVLTIQPDGEGYYKFVLPRNAYSPSPLPRIQFTNDNTGAVESIVFIQKDGTIEGPFKKVD